MKVQQFYNKNQFIITSENETVFQSYESTIATIKNGALILHDDWNYSKTTLKHLYLFLKDYWHKLAGNYRIILWDLDSAKNKREFLQKLIDDKKIDYIEINN